MATNKPKAPNRIDVSLDLVGENSREAVSNLVAQLNDLNTYLGNIKRGEIGTVNIAQSRRGSAGIQEGGISSHASIASDIDEYSQMGVRERYKQFGIRGSIDKHIDLAAARQAAEGRLGGGYENPYAVFGGEVRAGGVSSGASVGASNMVGGPAWRKALPAQGSVHQWLPPSGFGLSLQQKLLLASNAFQGVAESRYQKKARTAQAELPYFQPDPEEFLSKAGNISVLAREAAFNVAPYAQLAGGFLKGGASKLYNYGSEFQQRGVAAGYERAGQINLPGTDIGITNPLDYFKTDSAASEGLRQRVNEFRLKLKGGINGGQAQGIVQSLAQSGWTGRRGQDIGFDTIAPLVQAGFTPEGATESFDKIMRQGNASLQDFKDVMEKIGQTAKDTHLSLEETRQGLMEFSSTAQGLGGTGTQGMKLGESLAQSTGLAPQVLSQIIQSPIIKGFAAQSGYLPNQIGQMTGQEGMKALYGGIDTILNATGGFEDKKRSDGTIYTKEEQQAAFVAPMLNTTPDVILNLMRNEKANNAVGVLDPKLKQAEDKYKALDKYKDKPLSAKDTLLSHAAGASRSSATAFATAQQRNKDKPDTTEVDRELDRDWSGIDKALRDMAPDQKTDPGSYKSYMYALHNVENKKGEDRIKAARDLENKRKDFMTKAQETKPEYEIALTDEAKLYFKLTKKKTSNDKNRNDSNSGGLGKNSWSTAADSAGNTMEDAMKAIGLKVP